MPTSFMLKEISEQPEVLRALFSKESKRLSEFSKRLREKDIRYIGFVARGTSDHATLFAKYVLETENNIPVFHFNPSIFTLYQSKLDLKHFLVAGVSQSGESTDVVAVLKKAKEFGALTCSVTNEKESSIARAAQETFFLHAGKERAVAATKTYTATLYMMLLFSAALSGNENLLNGLRKTPSALERVLRLQDEIHEKCQRYRYLDECAVLARGFNLATAQETALKLEETCEVKALSFSAADFLHGPIVLAEKDFPVFLFASKGKTLPLMKRVMRTLREKKADAFVISNAKDILKRGKTSLFVDSPLEEKFTPLLFGVAGQLLAYHIACIKGLNPDAPRYLTKVTRTL